MVSFFYLIYYTTSLILNRIPYKITCKYLDGSATRNIAIALKNKKTLFQAVKKFL